MNSTKIQTIIHNMEDEVKIFVAGMKKVAKLKKVTQKTLAKAISKDQTTISNYYKGKTRPKHEYIEIFVDLLGVPYENILNTGRKELQPAISADRLEKAAQEIIEKKLPDLEAKIKADLMKKQSEAENDIKKYKIKKRHYDVVDQFQDPDKALYLNQLAVKLENLDPNEIDWAIKTLEDRVKYVRVIKSGEISHDNPNPKVVGGEE